MTLSCLTRRLCLGGLMLAATTMHAQQAPATARTFAFESYSVHASKECGGNIDFSDNRFVAHNASLFFLLYSAYAIGLQKNLEGLPAWNESNCYTMEARMSDENYAALQKLTPEERKSQQQHMKQQLLTEAFKLRIHAETRVRPVYELHQARGGAKLTPWPAGKDQENGFWSFDFFVLHNVSLKMFALHLTQILGVNVIDKTGLAGNYEMVLDPPQEESSDMQEAHARILTALEEKFGLKLTAAKGPVTVYVIDHAEKPAAN